MAAFDNAYPSTTSVFGNQPIEIQFASTSLDWTTYQHAAGWWSVPTLVEVVSVSWQMEKGAYDRAHLARLIGAVAPPPRVLRALVADRSPVVVRRAPRPAGRPYGWRRARKGGRRT